MTGYRHKSNVIEKKRWRGDIRDGADNGGAGRANTSLLTPPTGPPCNETISKGEGEAGSD